MLPELEHTSHCLKCCNKPDTETAGGLFIKARRNAQAQGLGLPPPGHLLVAKSGAACQVPLAYNGSEINTCVTILGNAAQPVCWVNNTGWQACPFFLCTWQSHGWRACMTGACFGNAVQVVSGMHTLRPATAL